MFDRNLFEILVLIAEIDSSIFAPDVLVITNRIK